MAWSNVLFHLDSPPPEYPAHVPMDLWLPLPLPHQRANPLNLTWPKQFSQSGYYFQRRPSFLRKETGYSQRITCHVPAGAVFNPVFHSSVTSVEAPTAGQVRAATLESEHNHCQHLTSHTQLRLLCLI